MSYQSLHDHFQRIGQLDEIAAIAEWDQSVNMPAAAGQARAAALASLARLRHQLLVDSRLGSWLEAVGESAQPDDWAEANVVEMRRLHRKAKLLSPELVEASSLAEKESELAWRRYRAENDFRSYAPHLERVIDLKREVASVLAQGLGVAPYDALLDEFEPGARAEEIDAVFAPLEAFLPDFTGAVIEHQSRSAVEVPTGPFPLEKQRALGMALLRVVGFDFAQGRVDVSHHPFCGGVPQDVRITTRYDLSDFATSLMGMLHEAGHAKYEQGLPRDWYWQPVGRSGGMALHESQSLLLEMQVCRSREFFGFASPLIREHLAPSGKGELGAFGAANLFALSTRVSRSKIRVDADEVTYPAHILVRYGLERLLLDGKLRVKDLPEAWDDRMRALLGVRTAGDDANGCLQDIHWPVGAFGYFPLYSIGAMIAAQLFRAALGAHPSLRLELAAGDFSTLDGWLREKVWRWGRRYSTQELVFRATGEQLHARSFIEHLRERYLPG